MMNPQMMQQAQAMMANMSPEQIASMQNMVQNMSPDQRANMERMAQQQMGGMGGVPPAASGQNQYQLGGARMLKDEGNNLHKAGKHTEALAKYDKAINNVSALSSAEAIELKTNCELNKAMCHLKLEQWKPCLDKGGNLKAYYRRGQAHMGLQKWPEAVKDLKHALRMCAEGDAQRDLISDKLTEALNRCPEGADINIDKPAPAKPKSYNDGSIVIEEVTDEPEIQPTSSSRPAMPPVGPGRAEYVADMMKNNPEQAREMMEQMGNLPPEEIQKMASMAGMPGFDANTAKQVAEMMKAMPPEQMQEMAQMAERMHSSGATAAAPGSSDAAGAAPAVDPGMAADMLQSMSPDQIASMAEAAKSSGMMPQGMELDADMIKMSAEMMKNMSKEDLARMQSMAASTGAPSAPAASGVPMGGAGGAAPPGNMAEMLNNPEAMNTAMNMMKNMDKEGLKNMLKMSQPGMTDEAAEKAAEAMKNMDERVMKVMVKGAAGFQKARNAANSLVEWIAARPAVMIALVVLMIAVILRVAGFM